MEEKFLVYYLSNSTEPLSPKQIYSELAINKSNCCNNLRKLEKNGFIKKVTNKYGVLLYAYAGSVEQHSSSVEQHLGSVEQHSQSAQLTNKKQTKQTNKKEKIEKLESEQPAANLPETPAKKPITKLVKLPPKQSRPNIRKDMPTIDLPKFCPKSGSFDGFIFADELPREKALDRMLEQLGFETPATNACIPRYELFKTAEQIIFIDYLKQDKRKLVFDDVVQRFAFAVAMEVPEFHTLDDLRKFLKKCKEESKSKIYAWIPALQILRQVYYNQQWGWDTDLKNIDITWSYEINRGDEPRLELFPAKKYELEKENHKPQNPPSAPITAHHKPQTTEEARDSWIKTLQENPKNSLAKDILVRNYNLTPDEINQLVYESSTTELAGC
jgi:predicted transcriptional regulator